MKWRKVHPCEIHPIRHFNIGELIVFVYRGGSLFAHRILVHDIAVHAVLALAVFRTLDPIRETRTILLVAFGLLARAKLALLILLDRLGAVLEMLGRFGPLLGVDDIPAAFALAEGGADSVVPHALAGGFDALTDLAMAELPSVGHQERIFHLYAGFAAGVGGTHLRSGRIAGALLSPAGGVAVAGVALGVLLV